MVLAGKSAVEHGKPVVLDPVGAGASAFRKASVLRILNEVNVTLIRCNAGELAAIADVEWQSKGVDAGKGDMDIEALRSSSPFITAASSRLLDQKTSSQTVKKQ